MAKQHQFQEKNRDYFQEIAEALEILAGGFRLIAEEMTAREKLKLKAIPTLEAGLEKVQAGYVRAREAINKKSEKPISKNAPPIVRKIKQEARKNEQRRTD